MSDDENALNRSLGRIEGKQDLILSNMDRLAKDHATLKDTVTSLDGRVSKVEKKMIWFAGAFASVSAILYYFRTKIVALLP
ncbi:hypothetical protein [uncultured Cohaesibacter sp.]|uniref:DUF7201 family protein n=1 Tax=uncultured Cohaesibacter sp. TaxID=1002546 RepID=UPI002930AE7E|nr:hypothetical protein [uncultured Cohaesibacter sp.]